MSAVCQEHEAEYFAGLLGGGADEREVAYAELLRREAEHAATSASSVRSATGIITSYCGGAESLVELAVACAVPLCAVLHKPVSEVSVEEYHRVCKVLAALCSVAPAHMGAQFGKGGDRSYYKALTQGPGLESALGAVLAKDPASLTRGDALTAGYVLSCFSIMISLPRGGDAILEVSGQTLMEWKDDWFPALFMLHAQTPTGDRNLALVPLMLELLSDPQKLPEFALPGILVAVGQGLAGRAAVATKALKLDAIPVLMNILQGVSAQTLVASAGYSRRGHGMAIWTMKELVEAATSSGIDLSAELLSCGFIDTVVSALSAVEQVGADNANGIVVCQGLLNAVTRFEGAALDQIEDKLRTVPSALRYLKDNTITHVSEWGWTSGTFAAILAANLYGRDEANTFNFTQADIEGMLTMNISLIRGAMFVEVWELAANTFRGMLNLCISDNVGKQLLLHLPEFIPHLLDGLLLDPEHPRKDADENSKAIVQRDCAECIQQISLFPPGCEALQAAPGVFEALDALIERAWTEEAKDCARGALLQLTGRHADVMVADPEELHIMMSYQWDFQRIVQRIVTELQHRGYLVWFDLERMKGSVIDAMSAAIEGAAVMLYGISESYKCSANCRMEAQYGIQLEKDMVPLMMERYRPTGWLGMILGSRLYYKFYGQELDDQSVFEERIQSLLREVGDRGKVRAKAAVSEGVPPALASAPAPALAPAPAPAPAPAAAAVWTATRTPRPTPASAVPERTAAATSVSTQELECSPSVHMQVSPAPTVQHQTADDSVLIDVMRMIIERDDKMIAKLEQQQKEMETKLAAKDAKLAAILEQQQQEMETKLAAKDAKLAELMAPAPEAISDQQMASLQARLERIHTAKLLADEELYALEDLMADFVELKMTTPGRVVTEQMVIAFSGSDHGVSPASKLLKLVGLSAAMESDAAFSRQVRRRFL